MIDASKGFFKDGNKNRLRHQDIHKIVDVFNNQIKIEKYSRMVSHAEIERNEFNLNIPRYIDSQEPEDIQDIEAHLLGGIPNHDIDDLEKYWQVFPALKSELFGASDREKYSNLLVEQSAIKDTIYNHPEFVSYASDVSEIFSDWRIRHTPVLQSISGETKPKELIRDISEDLLKSFGDVRLIDRYDIYQQLMSYWTDTMQDDVYMIKFDSWEANEDLITPPLIINRYFQKEQAEIERLESERETITREREEMEEEHGGEDGLFEEAKTDGGKLTKASINGRIKELQQEKLLSGEDEDSKAELEALENLLALIEREAAASKKVRTAKTELERKVSAQYRKLEDDEVKTLVIDDKWMTTLDAAFRSELERIAQNLTQRIKRISERYETPLPHLATRVENLTAKVDDHLNKMGFSFELQSKAANIE